MLLKEKNSSWSSKLNCRKDKYCLFFSSIYRHKKQVNKITVQVIVAMLLQVATTASTVLQNISAIRDNGKAVVILKKEGEKKHF